MKVALKTNRFKIVVSLTSVNMYQAGCLRSSDELPFQMIYHKTFYKESDVMKFIETHFSRFHTRRNKKDKK